MRPSRPRAAAAPFFANLWAAPVHGADALGPARVECAEGARGAHPGADAVGARVQALNAVWMALGPQAAGGGQLATAVALGGHGPAPTSGRARPGGTRRPPIWWRPTSAGMGFANVLSEGVWRRAPEPETLH